MSSFIDVKNLIYEYKNVDSVRRAVNNINIQIQKGKFIVVLGHNGSGKSTFAKHLNAIFTPTSGTVLIDGLDTKDDNKVLEIRQKCGMVFQNPDNQIIASVVEEDVGFGPENMGVPTDEILTRVKDSLAAVGMSGYAKHSPNKLSGGQKQRVAIAGIMAMRPKCIVLDEPTAMLDPIGRKEVLKTVHKLNKNENITIILITHYMNEVIDADKVFVMEEGKVVLQGTPREVFSEVERLESYRLDVPQVTKLAYELKKSGVPIDGTVLTVEEFREAIKKCYS